MKTSWDQLFQKFGLLKFIKKEDVTKEHQLIFNQSKGESQLQTRMKWSALRAEISNITNIILGGGTVGDESDEDVVPEDGDTPAGASLQVTAQDPLFVTDVIAGGIRTIDITNVPYTAPVISLTGNTIVETGSSNTGSWNVEFVEGRDSITSRTVTPIDGSADVVPGDIINPFVLTSTNTTKATSGVVTVFDLSTSDGTSTPVDSAIITFRANVFQFFSTKDGVGSPILEADIEAGTPTLDASVLTTYGGTNAYVIPGALNYIYWAYEVGTTEITSVSEGPLPVPLKTDLGNIVTTNSEGATITYRIIRTLNAFNAATKNLTMI